MKFVFKIDATVYHVEAPDQASHQSLGELLELANVDPGLELSQVSKKNKFKLIKDNYELAVKYYVSPSDPIPVFYR